MIVNDTPLPLVAFACALPHHACIIILSLLHLYACSLGFNVLYEEG